MTDLFTDTQLDAALVHLPQWAGQDRSIVRTVECVSFPAAIALVDAVAVAAEAADHHPDIDIRWRTVTFVLSTHSEGGVTEQDLAMATQIDQTAARAQPGDPAGG